MAEESMLRYHGGSWVSVAPSVVSSHWYILGVHFTSADEGWAVGGMLQTFEELCFTTKTGSG